MKRKKSGFSIIIDNVKFHVYFRVFNNKVTKCYLSSIVGEKEGDHSYYDEDDANVFVGESHCNFEEGDVFDAKIGRTLALEDALKKYSNSTESLIRALSKHLKIHKVRVDVGICHKYNKFEKQEIFK